MSSKYQDPFSEERVGLTIGQLTVQGGAEELVSVIAEEFNMPVYTLRWDPQKFDKRVLDKLADRVILLEKSTQDEVFSGEGFPSTMITTRFSLRLSELQNVDLQSITPDKIIAGDAEGALMAYKTGKPYVSYVHYPNKVATDYFWELFDSKKSVIDKLKFLKRRWRTVRDARKAAAGAEHIMVNAERTRQKTLDNWKVPEDKVSVVYPPCDTDFFTPGEGESPFGGAGYFLAVQRLEPYKNIHTIIEAAKRSHEHIILVGSGTLEDYVRREAQYSKYVHAYGYVDNEKLRDLYRGADATIQGATKEPYGMVPPESMACGTPCITPASGGFLETIGNGYEPEPPETYRTDRGILIGPDDYTFEGLSDIMHDFDPDDYDEDSICDYAQQFSTERFIGEVSEVLDLI